MGKSVASTGSKQTMKPGKIISTEMMLKSVNLARRKIESNQESALKSSGGSNNARFRSHANWRVMRRA